MSQQLLLQGTELAKATVDQVEKLNRRTMDQLTAKVYFYYVRFHELTDKLAEIRPYVSTKVDFLLKHLKPGRPDILETDPFHRTEHCWQLNEQLHCEEMMIHKLRF